MDSPNEYRAPETGQLFSGTQILDLAMRRNDNAWRRRFPVMSYPIIYDDMDGIRKSQSIPLDTTGWSTRMQIRMFEGQPGPPLVALDLTTYTTYSDGSVHSDGAPFSQGASTNGSGIVTGYGFVEVFITLGDLVLLPVPPFGEGPAIFTYDLMLQPSDGDENAWYAGKILLSAGTTRYPIFS